MPASVDDVWPRPRAVWGSEDQADLPTLRTHVTNLRRKLEGDSDLPRLILTEPGVGYRLVTQPAGS